MLRFRDHVGARLDDLRARQLLRDPVTSTTPAGTHLTVRGQRLLNLCSNNYLGLADHPRLRDALVEAAARWGSAGASRLISGSLTPHREAEAALSAFVGHDDARLFSSGYAANLGAISGLVGPDDVVFSDALNHASLIDGCRLSRARVIVYPHADVPALRHLLEEHRSGHRAALIVTDAVFSMDADVAPLRALRAVADHWDAGLLVDEAHALGVLGPQGCGLAASLEVKPDLTTGMLGKSLGLAGGFVAGDAATVRLLETTARSYVFSTGVHAALAAAIPESVRLVRAADDARARVRAHRALLADAVPRGRLASSEPSVPVLPIVLGEPARALAVSHALRRCGFFVQAIRPPTVPVGTARLRLVPIATHAAADIAAAATALTDVLSRDEASLEEAGR
jgi:8-amino-7-oxononanoate synthase